MRLNEAEFLIAFVLEDLTEQRHIMIILEVGFDPVDNGSGPLYNDVLQSVLLIQVGIHVLLHGLTGLPESLTLFIKLNLLRVDIIDNVLQLLQSESTGRGYSKRQHALLFLVV